MMKKTESDTAAGRGAVAAALTNYTRTKKFAVGGLMVAFGMILPQMFHLTGVPQSGMVFLPMHIPVLLSGYLLGPWFGILIGLICPTLSAVTTGMPALGRLPFMMIELALYGFVSGFFFQNLGLYRKKGGIYISLVFSLLAGRLGYAAAILIAAALFHIQAGGMTAVVIATATGLPGIIIQMLLIPTMIYTLKRGGMLNEFYRES